jgi:plastocyanin
MSRKVLFPFLALVLAVIPAAVPAPEASPAVTYNVTNNGLTSYMIDGSSNPSLTLTRGDTYTFQIVASGHPFWIKTVKSIGTGNAYSSGVTGNGTDNGTLTFTVPLDAPSTLFYDCQFHFNMSGTINIVDPVPTLRETWGKLKTLFVHVP